MSNDGNIDFLSIRMGRLSHPELGFLWIGSKTDAADLQSLESQGIHFVINCTRDHLEGGVKNYHETVPGFRYCRIPLKDNEHEVMELSLLQQAWRFIRKAQAVGSGVLVHCAMGKSRSSAVLISYIMHATGCSFDDAITMVKGARNVSEPNPAFADQLKYMYLSGDIKKLD